MGNTPANDLANTGNNKLLVQNGIVKVGWLIKKGSTRKTWNKRYVLLLSTSLLVYFNDSNCTEHRGTLGFAQLKTVNISPKEATKFIMVTQSRRWEFKAYNNHDAQDWVNKIRLISLKSHKTSPSSPVTAAVSVSPLDSFKHEMHLASGGLMGWLTKKGELRRNWNSRFTILIPSRLIIYFTDETCENFKGCADFRGYDNYDLMILFDDLRKNYFFIQTSIRLWEFKCNNSIQVKQWATSLQYLIDIDKKVLVLKGDPDTTTTSNDIVNYFHKYVIKQLYHINNVFIIMFDNDTTIQNIIKNKKRIHIIMSSSNSNQLNQLNQSNNNAFKSRRSKLLVNKINKSEFFALKFSEYLGNVESMFSDNVHINDIKTFKSKVHGLSSFTNKNKRRLSQKQNNKKNKKHLKSKSLSFRDKYSQSALDEFKQIYADNNSDNSDNDNKQQKKLSIIMDDQDINQDINYDDTDSSSVDDAKEIRITSVANRGIQQYNDPNVATTYKNSSLFNFSSPQKSIIKNKVKLDALIDDKNDDNNNNDQDDPDDSDDSSYEYCSIDIDDSCPIIIDNGSGYIKAGFGVSDQPLSIPNQCILSPNDNNYYFGADISSISSNASSIINPISRCRITDWSSQDKIWKYICLNKLGLDYMYEHPIIITESPSNNIKDRNKQLQHFMEEYQLKSFYMINTALSNFYYTGKSRNDYCVIVDCGHQTINISCIYMGCYLSQYSQTINCGGDDITKYLYNQLTLRNTHKNNNNNISYRIAAQIKEKLCYVAPIHYHLASKNLINKHYILPDGTTLDILNEQYEASEIIFCPSDPLHIKKRGSGRMRGNKSSKKSLDSQIINCINKIDDDEIEKNMISNIYCCGGTIKLNGFINRLQTELTSSLSRRMSIVSTQAIRNVVNVKSMKEPNLSAWYGTQIVSNMDIFKNKWITNQEYNEYGQNILLRKCNHQDL